MSSELDMNALGNMLGTMAGLAGYDTNPMLSNADAIVAGHDGAGYMGLFDYDSLLNMYGNNALFKSDYTKDDFYKPDAIGIASGIGKAVASGASAGTSVAPGWGTLIGAAAGLLAGGAGAFAGHNKAKSAAQSVADRVNASAAKQNQYMKGSFDVTKNNIDMQQKLNAFKALGGPLDGVLPGYGGLWSDGLTFIENGGTHGQNPIGGVPVGSDAQGNPNLVEEGEVIWNDYVFSNRIKIPEDIISKYKLKGKKDMSFADAVKKAQEPLGENPNDPIEKRGLEALLANLMIAQEDIRQKKQQEDAFNLAEDIAAFAADGGPIHIAKNKRGTFTAAATKHGMGVQEFASKVLANPERYSESMRKKAQFARNSASWEHAFGGILENGGPKNPPTNRYNYASSYWSPYDTLGIQQLTPEGYTSLYRKSPAPNPIANIAEEPVARPDNPSVPMLNPYMMPDYSKLQVPDINLKPNNKLVTLPQKPAVSAKPVAKSVARPVSNDTIALNTPQLVDPETNAWYNDFDPEAEAKRISESLLPFEAEADIEDDVPVPVKPVPEKPRNNAGAEAYLRFAPILGDTLNTVVSLADKPDYSYADYLVGSTRANLASVPELDMSPIGDYMAYTPIDRMFYSTKLGNQLAAQRRAIAGTSNANRGAVVAGLAAANAAGIGTLGDLFYKENAANRNMYERVARFNRKTNIQNASNEAAVKAANQQLAMNKANALSSAQQQALAMKQAEDRLVQGNRSLALSSLFENAGNVGREAAIRNIIVSNPGLYYSIDSSGKISYKNMDKLSDEEKDYVTYVAEKKAKKKGGK